ncbi:MAG: PCYCGC domain-containing protein [Acidobacteriia bacterium]|nr:PCYCGC domain-containing protein [Terriglobia bacterium]
MLTLAIIGATAIVQAQYSSSSSEMPAFHDKAPAKGQVLPPVLTGKQLVNAGYNAPVQTESYKAAARVQGVMYQMPCYCFCDRNHGHQSLRTCFESDHGANCGVCMGEALYVYKMSKKGWTPKMIRDGIVRGDYKTMDLQHPEPVI